MTPAEQFLSKPFTASADHVAQFFKTDLAAGLPGSEAGRRLEIYGANELPEPLRPSVLHLLAGQFSSIIVWILIGAAAVSGLLGEWVDAGAILAIVLLNALLGFVQEFKAERSLAALRKYSVTTARVIRDDVLSVIPARELAPGDLIQIEAGDRVPADARLVYQAGLRTQEAALTGESMPVDKTSEVLAEEAAAVADRTNMIFLGTHVAAGKGRAVVVATGLNTELGSIATLMRATDVDTTPLQQRLEKLGYLLLYVSLGIVTLIFVLGLLRGEPLVAMFMTAVSLAVAAIPEGLPAVVTIALALGVSRMVKRHALVRRLPAVETLGSATVICTDKTGTLTKNEMTVTRFYVGGKSLEVTEEGYAPQGQIQQKSEAVVQLLTAAVLCNDSSIRKDGGVWNIVGDPTEGALLVAAAKAQLWKESLEEAHALLGEIPFDPERKMMTVVRRTEGKAVAYVKGAPDILVGHCTSYLTHEGNEEPLSEPVRESIRQAYRTFAQEALRVLGIARRRLEAVPTAYRASELERDLTFLGLAAIKDPLRPEAIEAVHRCRTAGIRIVMITGDHKATAVAIGRELGILDGYRALSGPELAGLSEEALRDVVERTAVYARVSAAHKLLIVRAWKSRGAVVAMTGDGVNDAPAVKEADIGIAMGLTGTDVTKEASDMVVTDDNFASIAAAVEEGRGIYANIRKTIHYLLSCNISEVAVMLLATLGGLPLPLLPVQILWTNLVTDGLPALALAVDPPDPGLMQRPPRRPDAPILSTARIVEMFIQGLFMAAVTIGAFAYGLYGLELDVTRARTIAFTVLVMQQLFFALSSRSRRYALIKLGLLTNQPLLWAVGGSAALQAGLLLHPALQGIFKTAALSPEYWFLAFVLGLLPLMAMEVWKWLRGQV